MSARAQAQELDTLLPASIPGYVTPFSVIAARSPHRAAPAGLQFGDLAVVPQLAVSQGYDSAPNGAAGSPVSSASPSLLIADERLGFGAFAAANVSRFPQNNPQNTAGTTFAAGEKFLAPRETITISAGLLKTQETGFALDTIAISRPIAFTVRDVRGSDEISAGMFTFKPELSDTAYSFPAFAAQNRTDEREALTTIYLPAGPLQYLLRLQATQSTYRETIFNAATNQALAGIVDTADGLWTLSVLAGAAQRQSRVGPAITAPVLEAGLDWIPGDLDRLRLTVAREIDDPDEVSEAAYTLTQAKFSLSHQYATDIVFKLAVQASNAAYFHSPLRETLVTTDANFTWQFGPNLSVNGDYAFNDRQANYLRAANEHILTLGLTWTV